MSRLPFQCAGARHNSGTRHLRCLRCKRYLKTKGDNYELEVTDEARALSHVLLSGKFHHGDDMKDVSLKPDPRMAEIPALIEKYKSYLTYSRPDRAKTAK